jgi:hypothetical protein
MEATNPFKQMEPDVVCPPNLKTEIVSEVDLIRNSLQVVEVYAYDIFSVLITFVSELIPDEKTRA